MGVPEEHGSTYPHVTASESPACLMSLSQAPASPQDPQSSPQPRPGSPGYRPCPPPATTHPPELLPCPQVASLKKQPDQEAPRHQQARLGQALRAKK